MPLSSLIYGATMSTLLGSIFCPEKEEEEEAIDRTPHTQQTSFALAMGGWTGGHTAAVAQGANMVALAGQRQTIDFARLAICL